MSLAVVNYGGTSGTTSPNVGQSSLADLNLTATQSAQVEQILAELQSGMISPVEARAQIASVVIAPPQTQSTGSSPQSQAVTNQAQSSEPLQQYYELPLPQESLKGAGPSYNSLGAAADTAFSTPKTVNASA